MSAIFVGGSKGGVGKSLVSCLVLHSLIRDGQKPILIETDDSNPDVLKTYQRKLQAMEEDEEKKEDNPFFCNMDTERGWQAVFKKIYDLREKNVDRPVVINTGARNILSIEKFGALFDGVGDIITLWVIDNGRESLNLLDDYLKICHQKITVVKNGFFSEEKYFDYFEKSIFNNEEKKIPNVYIEKATLGIISALQKRIPFDEMDSSLHVVDRILASDWIKKASNSIQKAINIASIYES